MNIAIPFAVLIPVMNEQEVLASTLSEWLPVVEKLGGRITVGVNGSRDDSVAIAKSFDVSVGVTALRGYGQGCMAAIGALQNGGYVPEAYVFVSADGSNAVEDLPRLLDAAGKPGADLVLGQRTRLSENVKRMGRFQWTANWILGASCWLWCGRVFCDLGPFRWIRRDFFERLEPRELGYGFTIESQVMAVRWGAGVEEVDVQELARVAGEQKISGGSMRRRFQIGMHILGAGARCRRR